MKKIFYYSILVIFSISCGSVQDLVDKGDYDGAIELAARKLQGEEKRKTKYVKALESAFSKVMKRDMEEVAFLKSRGSGQDWDRVHSILENIKFRQERISPFLPLISEDGYTAHFKFLRVLPLLDEASENAAKAHFNLGMMYFNQGSEKNKQAFRAAFLEFEKVEKYPYSFEELDSLMQMAHTKGVIKTWIVTRNLSDMLLPVDVERDLLYLEKDDINSFWNEYYFENSEELDMDRKAVLEFNIIEVSPEREKERYYTDEKRIVEGTRYVLDADGNVLKDSLGNDVKIPDTILVKADIVELLREKRAFIQAELKVFDLYENEVLETKPVEAEAGFESYASRFKGDKRALSSSTKRKLKENPEPFPSDYLLIIEAATEIKIAYLKHLKQI